MNNTNIICQPLNDETKRFVLRNAGNQEFLVQRGKLMAKKIKAYYYSL